MCVVWRVTSHVWGDCMADDAKLVPPCKVFITNTYCSGNEECEVSASCKHCNVSCWPYFKKIKTQLPSVIILPCFLLCFTTALLIFEWDWSGTEYTIDRGDYMSIIEVLRILKFQYQTFTRTFILWWHPRKRSQGQWFVLP